MADIDPGYGGYAGSNALLANASNTPAVANQWAQNRLLNATADTAQLDLARKKLGALNDVASSIMADPSAQNATARIQDAVQSGVLDPNTAAQQTQQLAAFGGDPAKIKQWAFQHSQQIADYSQRIEAAYGAPSAVNTGNALTPVLTKTGPGAGIYPAGGAPLPLQQSPGELASPVTVTDASGTPHQMTQGQFQTQAGQPPGKGYGYGAVAAGQASVVNGKIVYNGAKSAAGAPQPINAQGVAVTASGQPTTVATPAPGTMPGIAGPTPGTAQAADVTAQASAAMGNQLTKSADASSGSRAILSNMQDQLAKMNATGPGSEKVNALKAGANAAADLTLGPGRGPRFDQSAIAATEEFHKSSELLAQQQQQALGGTDAGLASGKASVPNLGNSTMGNKAILAMLQGNQDAIEAKNAAWQDWQKTHGSGTYGQFAVQFNKTFSPRAFQFYRMDKADRQSMFDNMSPQDRQALANAMQFSQDQGWIRNGR